MLRKTMLCCAGAVGVLAFSAPQASAQTVDRRTNFTFSGPVEMPGLTLPAGKYTFRLADPDGPRDVIQVVSNDDRKKVWGMFFSIPINRAEAPSKPEVRFMETAAGVPPAIRTYWKDGERTGREFIYPKEQARRLARTAKEPVLTTHMQTTKPEETKSGDLERLSASGEETQVVADGTQAVVMPATGTAQTGDAFDNTDNQPKEVTRMARAALPETASSMPLVGVLGLCFLAAAGARRFWGTRTTQA